MKPLEIEFHYRIVNTPSWQVQSFHDGEWITMWYCANETAAKLRLCAQVERRIEFAKMTDEERQALCLRDDKGDLWVKGIERK